MTDREDRTPELEPEPEDERRPGDAIIMIVMGVIIAYLIGYGALYYAGAISGRTPPNIHEETDKRGWDYPSWGPDEGPERRERDQ